MSLDLVIVIESARFVDVLSEYIGPPNECGVVDTNLKM